MIELNDQEQRRLVMNLAETEGFLRGLAATVKSKDRRRLIMQQASLVGNAGSTIEGEPINGR